MKPLKLGRFVYSLSRLSHVIHGCDAQKFEKVRCFSSKSDNEYSRYSNRKDRDFKYAQRRPGDWKCSACNSINFRSITICRRCEKPVNKDDLRWNNEDGSPFVEHRNSWPCPVCNVLNRQGRMQCFRCNEKIPREIAAQYNFHDGSFVCTRCHVLNFAGAESCKFCGEAPPAELNSSGNSDHRLILQKAKWLSKSWNWQCPICEYRNLKYRWECYKCRHQRDATCVYTPSNEVGEYPVTRFPGLPCDWICGACSRVNFKHSKKCTRCKADNDLTSRTIPLPESAYFGGHKDYRLSMVLLPPGSWRCATCEVVNEPRNKYCHRCKKRTGNDSRVCTLLQEWGVGEAESLNTLNSLRNIIKKTESFISQDLDSDSLDSLKNGQSSHSLSDGVVTESNLSDSTLDTRETRIRVDTVPEYMSASSAPPPRFPLWECNDCHMHNTCLRCSCISCGSRSSQLPPLPDDFKHCSKCSHVNNRARIKCLRCTGLVEEKRP